MRTYDLWFSRFTLRNKLMFFCQLFSPSVRQGSSTLLTFLACRTQRVDVKLTQFEVCQKKCMSEWFLVDIFLANTDIAETKVSLESL